jgi:hypothetical protein
MAAVAAFDACELLPDNEIQAATAMDDASNNPIST